MRIFLQGVALGILFATVVISYSLYSSPLPHEQETKELSISDAKAFLQAQGFTIQKSILDETAKVIPNNKKVEPKESLNDTAPMSEESVGEYELNIVDGMFSEDVAALLYQNNIVEDEAGFKLYLNVNGYERKIQLGTYLLNAQMSYEEISETIIKR